MTWSQVNYLKALRFAAEKHNGQLVPGTDLPYLMHVVSVAMEAIASLEAEPQGIDGDTLIAIALLHDTLEDTATSYDEVLAIFGLPVADSVKALTKDTSLPRAERMPDSLQRIQATSLEAMRVKLCDRITNLQPAPAHWTSEKKREYLQEARLILEQLGEASAFLADRLQSKIDQYLSLIAK